ncbi:single-stranded DNA-binding protein [Candidatus Kaiserbacteria bacterium RIFOXYB1_FULL_46_14]|uniref:Single-stranded DNA-binding protein n=1 Tax=Candidatus Kaiserbacteria bacterium RIFOXYB1_FULL_46_14 TaxID=1798531 RepID=A0A1F6FIG5_9BACT|nr:MAG: single-stranded DNA-binding protein [Candidatus Kaiserbacteria bacterium RIFOXYB1_FULL_46_14]
MYINKVMLYGNLTRDPEKRALPSGQAVCSFAIATNRTYTDKDGKKQEQTEYHDIVAFGKLADVMGQWLKKGRPVYLEGRLQTRSWEQDGVKRYRTEVVADTFQFGADAGRGTAGGDSAPAPTHSDSAPAGSKLPDYPEEEINPEDIPF